MVYLSIIYNYVVYDKSLLPLSYCPRSFYVGIFAAGETHAWRHSWFPLKNYEKRLELYKTAEILWCLSSRREIQTERKKQTLTLSKSDWVVTKQTCNSGCVCPQERITGVRSNFVWIPWSARLGHQPHHTLAFFQQRLLPCLCMACRGGKEKVGGA